MPHIHAHRRGTRPIPFVVSMGGLGQIDFGATRVPVGGTRDISRVPHIRLSESYGIPGYVTGAPSGPPRVTLRDTPATRVAGGPSVLGPRNSSPLPTGYGALDTGVHTTRESANSPPSTQDAGQVAIVPAPSTNGMQVNMQVNEFTPSGVIDTIASSETGPVSVDGTIEVPPVSASGAHSSTAQFQLPFGLKWWHLGVVGGLGVAAFVLMKRR